ncbi:MAG: rhomboid family intramembrane serine protease [Phycisphaerales bacterium JB063]
MLIPIRSDRPLRSTPYVNYALIVVNVVLFIVTLGPMEQAHTYFEQQYYLHVTQILMERDGVGPLFGDGEDWAEAMYLEDDAIAREAQARAEALTSEKFIAYRLMLHKHGTLGWQFLTYQFMHGGFLHLIGNMIFLWVFGNNVEDRLGKLGYLFFYLSAGVFAGLGHWLTSDAPVLGASGSVAGVTGVFLALFPRTRIGFVYFWMLIGFFEVPAMLVVIFFFAKDVFLHAAGSGGVAYTAHISGTLAGFALGMGLLLTRMLPREPYDLLTLIEHRRRREKFRKITRTGYQPWEGRHGGKGPHAPPTDPVVTKQRRDIAQLAAEHKLPEAAAQYAALLKESPSQVLNERLQTDIANQLATAGDFASAAQAYELLIKTYPTHPQRADMQLMLGLIYARYLDRPAQARPHLEQAEARLIGEAKTQAQDVLRSLGS